MPIMSYHSRLVSKGKGEIQMIIGPMFSGKVLVEKLNEVMRLSKTIFDDLLVILKFCLHTKLHYSLK